MGKEDQQKLFEENSRLREFNSKLQLDNASLQEENTELKQRLGINPVNPQLTLELPLSPLSNPPASPAMSPSAVSPSNPVTSSYLQPPESSAGTGLQTGATPVARVVVERLDSLGAGVFGDNVVCGAADEDTGFTILSHSPAQPASPDSDLFGPPSPDCAQLTAEKE